MKLIEKAPKIIQIIPVLKSLVAVFKCDLDIDPGGIDIMNVYAIELMEDSDGDRFERVIVVDTICEGGGLGSVDDYSGFLGYAKNEEEAKKMYGKDIKSIIKSINE